MEDSSGATSTLAYLKTSNHPYPIIREESKCRVPATILNSA